MAMPFKIGLLENIGGALLNERPSAKVVEIGIERIYPNPNQPRRKFNEDDIRELAESIRQNGLIQPIVVRRFDIGYELIAGERRLRACRMAGLTEVSCIIVEATERESAILSLVENMQRRDLNYFEEAESINNMIDLFGYTQEDVAIRLGKSQPFVANKVRLLKFSRQERKLMIDMGLTERHARALLKIDDMDIRIAVIHDIYDKKLNVENTERLVDTVVMRNKELKRIHKCRGAFRDVRLFVNTINHAVEIMQAAGIKAELLKTNCSDYTEYIVRIPNKSSQKA